MAVRIEGAAHIAALAQQLKGADKVVRQELGKGLRAGAKPVVAQIRAAVKQDGGGTRGAGARARAAHRLSRSRSKRATAAASAEKRSGLRATIAAATGSSVSVGPDRANLTFRMRSSQLPPSQVTLGKRWNMARGWRHPVFGHGTWVQQNGHPYFDVTIKANEGLLAASTEAALRTAIETIQAGHLP
ncbi:hypothetical protein [Streptacidiphilus sp. EB103A]|uniref:hypothetical protein n=1 Tax=Streptacidiphilus sp. EB103A TaxID=3156275 RepID=UPI0035148D4E